MPRIALLTLLIALGISAYGQTNESSAARTKLDTLWDIWYDVTLPDTIRTKAIDDLAWDGFMYSNPDSAIVLGNMMLDFATEKGIKHQMSAALNTIGVSYWSKADYANAVIYYKEALNINEETGNIKGTASNLNNIGAVYHNQGDYPQALTYFTRSQAIYEELGDDNGIALCLNNIGKIYNRQGDRETALAKFEESLRINEKINDLHGIPGSLMDIGSIYAHNKDYENALEYYNRALAIYIKNENNRSKAVTLVDIGNVLEAAGRSDEAITYLKEGLNVAEEMENGRAIAISNTEIGKWHLARQHYSEAIKYCKKGIDQLKLLQLIPQQKKACDCLYEANKGLGRNGEALKYHEQMAILDESLQEVETVKKLQQMEFEKKMQADSLRNIESDLLKQMVFDKKIEKQNLYKNAAIGSGLLLLLVAGGLFSRLRYTRRSKAILQLEKDRSESLLLNILPAEIAEELKEKGYADARDFDLASILFTDFISFTDTSEKLSAAELVSELDNCFQAFDEILDKYNVEKIKTIGDAYMAAGGVPIPADDAVRNTVLAAIEMQVFITQRKIMNDAKGIPAFEMRVGIHTGPVVAGIVGVKKFQYDIWGDTVNTASRMENNGAAGKINISQVTYEKLRHDDQFSFEHRGEIEVKGKGLLEMWYVKMSE